MSQLVNYSIIEAGLRALADKAHESAVAQAEGKPIPCGLSENDMELVALLTAMMNDTQANKGWCAHEMGKSISSFEKEVDAMLRQSKAILESVDYHERVVKSCEGMLLQLNPQIAKEKEQTEKINKLEGKVSGIEGKIDKMMGWLQQNINK